MSNRSLKVEQILILLAEAPRQIKERTGNQPIAQLRSSSHYSEWSVHDVLSHLRACADVWGKRIVEIITQDKPVLRAINPRTWIQQTDYPQQKFRTSLHAFAAQRTELLVVLAGIARQDWSRIAVVTDAGKPLERSVLFYAKWLASHERTHGRQIQRIVNQMTNP